MNNIYSTICINTNQDNLEANKQTEEQLCIVLLYLFK
jgi:hypothetical protein